MTFRKPAALSKTARNSHPLSAAARKRFNSASIAKPAVILLVVMLLSAPLFIERTKAGTVTQSPAAQQNDDVIRVNSDLVVLNATVLDQNGQFVSSLKQSDFKIFEDGQEQKVSVFSAEETPFAAAVLIDTSGSMETRMTLARGAAISFLGGLRDEDVAAIYSFDYKVERWQDFSPGRDLPPRVFTLHGKGMTTLNDAVLRAADDLALRAEKRHAIVVLSDGGENFSRASADKALEHALKANATVYAVNMSEEGPGRDIQGSMILKNFAAKSGGTYVSSPGGQALRDAFAAIGEELSHQYTLGYRPANRERDGKWRAVEVKLNRADATVRTRKGYRAPKA
jgi:Ca-activated chloride channel family protein